MRSLFSLKEAGRSFPTQFVVPLFRRGFVPRRCPEKCSAAKWCLSYHSRHKHTVQSHIGRMPKVLLFFFSLPLLLFLLFSFPSLTLCLMHLLFLLLVPPSLPLLCIPESRKNHVCRCVQTPEFFTWRTETLHSESRLVHRGCWQQVVVVVVAYNVILFKNKDNNIKV